MTSLPAGPSLDTPADSAGDAQWAADARQSLAHTDARLGKRFEQTENVERLPGLRARAVDQLIIEAWQRCIPAGAGLALFAVGGYGRGELFPRSDIDLLVLAETEVQQRHEAALARLFALLWDAGLPASHAVRSATQCVQAAADQTVLTALIEARPLVADATAQHGLARAIAPSLVWPPREYFLAKREELLARHQRFGDTADNLEPDIKDGPGGLRDLNTLGWMALRAFGVSNIDALVGLG
ncbi:MAG: nucleotidyltransferase domain-containing protein, partial [Stenotrophomonas sp.]